MGLEEGHETEKTFAQFDTDLFYLGLVLFPIMIVNIRENFLTFSCFENDRHFK